MKDETDLSNDESSTELEMIQMWEKLESTKRSGDDERKMSAVTPQKKKQKQESQQQHCPQAPIVSSIDRVTTQALGTNWSSTNRTEDNVTTYNMSNSRFGLNSPRSSTQSRTSDFHQPDSSLFFADKANRNYPGRVVTRKESPEGSESRASTSKQSDQHEVQSKDNRSQSPVRPPKQVDTMTKNAISLARPTTHETNIDDNNSDSDHEESSSSSTTTSLSSSDTTGSDGNETSGVYSELSDCSSSVFELQRHHSSKTQVSNNRMVDVVTGMEVEVRSKLDALIPASSTRLEKDVSVVDDTTTDVRKKAPMKTTRLDSTSTKTEHIQVPGQQNPYIKSTSIQDKSEITNPAQFIRSNSKTARNDSSPLRLLDHGPRNRVDADDGFTRKGVHELLSNETECIEMAKMKSTTKKRSIHDQQGGKSVHISSQLEKDTDSVLSIKEGLQENESYLLGTRANVDPKKKVPSPSETELSQEIAELPIPYNWPKPSTIATVPEVDFSLFAPSTSKQKPPPVLYRFTEQTHPMQSRRKVPITRFVSPVDLLWKSKFDHFNECQSEVADLLCYSDDHVVVSAPTGAGKSTIFEMAMARFITMDLQAQKAMHRHQGQERLQLSKARKILYMAPSKALCEERYNDWSTRLQRLNLGIEVAMITGDAGDPGNSFGDLVASHLVLTTPEKWDSMTRRWSENFFLMGSVKLILIDEVHHLGDESRGWCLESVLCRMKTVDRAAQSIECTEDDIRNSTYTATNEKAIKTSLRIVAVSATLPNISDVAAFVGANEAYAFDDSYRPVPLTKHVNGLGPLGKNEWRFWSNLDDHVPEIVKRFSHGKQSLIFCHTKNATEKIADMLIRQRCFGNRNIQTSATPGTIQYFLDHGVCYHHAGLERDDRQRVEVAFAEGKIRCLTATSTLAVGVNLPAHLVVVVGTRAWRGGVTGYQDIEISSILQMVGRAGRPGLDSKGIAVVMTDNDSKKRIEHLLESGLGPAKSKLWSRLPEVLNNEISQRVITSKEGALRWLKTTFLFCSMKISGDAVVSMESIRDDALNELKQWGLVEEGCDGSIEPLPGCEVMNQHMLSFDVLKTIASLTFDSTQYQILRSISKLESFHNPVRRNEKKQLKEVHKTEKVRHKLPGALSKFSVQDPSEKAFILLQCIISQHEFSSGTLRQEMTSITNDAVKTLQAAQDYCIHVSRHGGVLKECYKLHRSIYRCLWGESSGVLNQIEELGVQSVNLLRFNGIVSFQQALDCPEEVLAKYIGRQTSFVRGMKSEISKLMQDRLKLSAEIEYTRNSNIAAGLLCSLSYVDPTRSIKSKGEPTVSFCLVAYTDSATESSLIFEEKISSPCSFRAELPLSFGKISIYLIGTFVGFDQKIILDAKSAVFPRDRQEKGISSRRTIDDENRSRVLIMEGTNLSMIGDSRTKHKKAIAKIQAPNQKEKYTSPKQDSLTTRFPNSLQSHNSSGAGDPSPTITPPKPEFPPVQGSTRHSDEFFKENEWSNDQHSMRDAEEPSIINRNHQDRSIMWPIHRNNISSQASPVNVTPMNPVMSRTVPRTLEQQRQRASQQNYRSPLQTDDSSFASSARPTNIHNKGAAWNRMKRQQQQNQKRAFTKKGENPFANYRHDPNDAEGRLEGLSSSIIPVSALEHLSANHRGVQATNYTQRQRRRTSRPGNRHLTGLEFLAQQAHEMEWQQNHVMLPRSNHKATTHAARGERDWENNNGMQVHHQLSPMNNPPFGPYDVPSRNHISAAQTTSAAYCQPQPQTLDLHSHDPNGHGASVFFSNNLSHRFENTEVRPSRSNFLDWENALSEQDQDVPCHWRGRDAQLDNSNFYNSLDTANFYGQPDTAGLGQVQCGSTRLDDGIGIHEGPRAITDQDRSWLNDPRRIHTTGGQGEVRYSASPAFHHPQNRTEGEQSDENYRKFQEAFF